MTRAECFYCFEKDEESSPNPTMIHYNFGLRHCEKHKAAGERDCRAYMYREGMVRFKDAMKHACFQAFVRHLEELPNGFPVRRSNGELQNGWKLQKEITRIDPIFVLKIRGFWAITVEKDMTIQKNIPLTHFEGIVPQDVLDECIKLFASEIYKKDNEEYEAYLNRDVSNEVEDIKGIVNGIYDGRPCKVLVPY